jgi:membrane protease YdiL (CAAX protease family)
MVKREVPFPGITPPMTSEQRRLALVLILTLLPWPAVWLGMYMWHSLWVTFFLYHGLCLLPSVIIGSRLWRGAWRLPTRGQWLALAAGVVISLPLFLLGYTWIGARIIDAHTLLAVVTARGFAARDLLPLGFYFVPVNAALEELFWRGVVLNELRGVNGAAWTVGAVWTAVTFAAWHWLVLRLLLRPGWAELAVLGIVMAGGFFSWLYRRTGSIVVPILWHGLVFDLALILVFAAVLRAQSGMI